MTFWRVAALGAVVLPPEGDAVVVEGDEAAVGDGDAVGVAGEIGEHRLGPGEGPLGVDDPLDLAQRRQIRGEGMALGERRVIAEEVEAAGIVRGRELLQEQPAEQPREHAHGQEEARPAGDPALAVGREAAARHDAVDVRVMGERRAPGMEHGGEADPGPEMLGVGGDGDQRLGRGLEEDGVDRRLVLVGDVGDRRRQREHDVVVGHRQAARPRGRPATPSPPRPGTSGNAGCGRSCRRCGCGRTSRSARHGRRAPPCGSARSPT